MSEEEAKESLFANDRTERLVIKASDRWSRWNRHARPADASRLFWCTCLCSAPAGAPCHARGASEALRGRRAYAGAQYHERCADHREMLVLGRSAETVAILDRDSMRRAG